MIWKKIIEIMNKINSSMGYSELIASITEAASELLNAEGASLLIVDRDRDELIFDVVASEKGAIIQGKRIKIGVGIAGHVAKSGMNIVVNDVSVDTRFYNAIDSSSGFQTRSIAAVPVKTRDKLEGVLEVVNSNRTEGFNDDDILVLSYLSDAVAVALHKNELVHSLQSRLDELTCIYEVSQAIYFSDDPVDLFNRVLKSINDVLAVERSSFVILEDDCRAIRYFVSSNGAQYQIDLDDSVIAHVVRTGDPLIVYNLDNEEELPFIQKRESYRTKSFLSIPLKLDNKILGVLSVTDRISAQAFDAFDLRVLSTIAQQVAVMYDSIRVYGELLERKKIDHDLEIAAEIQRQSLSVIPENVQGLSIGGFINPARYIGGDFFEVTEFNGRFLSIAVGDISGKGIPAAIFLGTVRNALRHEIIRNNMPEGLFRNVNRWVCRESANGMFCTFFYALIDREDHLIHYSSAGHNPQVFYSDADDSFASIRTVGKPFGIMTESNYRSKSIPYKPGDLLVLFTDGLIEQGAASEFTMEEMEDILRKNKDNSAGEIAAHFERIVTRRTEDVEPHDDSALIVVKFE